MKNNCLKTIVVIGMIMAIISYIAGRNEKKEIRCQEFKIITDNLNLQLKIKGIAATVSLPECR
jgi:hypothetical protein